MNTIAPIVLFAYNRPEHTLRLLESLALNDLADQSELFIYADGPKADANEEMVSRINEVHSILQKKKWCKKVEIYRSEVNRGLARSIVSGISEIIKTHGSVIVLEDDLYLSKGFLTYMNNGLNYYQNNDKVMHVSGYVLPVKQKLEDTFFFRVPFSWGWATWDRAWQHYSENVDDLVQRLTNHKNFGKFNNIRGYDYMGELLANKENEMKTWLINWYASMFLKDGLCLIPGKSLARNMGFDSSGQHCNEFFGTPLFHTQELADNVAVSNIDIEEHEEAAKYFSRIYKRLYEPNLVIRAKEKLQLMFGSKM